MESFPTIWDIDKIRIHFLISAIHLTQVRDACSIPAWRPPDTQSQELTTHGPCKNLITAFQIRMRARSMFCGCVGLMALSVQNMPTQITLGADTKIGTLWVAATKHFNFGVFL